MELLTIEELKLNYKLEKGLVYSYIKDGTFVKNVHFYKPDELKQPRFDKDNLEKWFKGEDIEVENEFCGMVQNMLK